MPIKLNSSGGGSITVNVPNMSAANTVTLPNSPTNSSLVSNNYTGDISLTGGLTLTGNVTNTKISTQVTTEAAIPTTSLTYYTDFTTNVSGGSIGAALGSGTITMNQGSIQTNESRRYWRFQAGITTGAIASSNIASIVNRQSIAFWIRTGRTPSQTDEFGLGFKSAGAAGTGFYMMYGVNGANDLGFWGYSADYYPYNNSSYFTQDTLWHHIVMIKNDTNAAWFYHNGELIPGVTTSPMITGLSNTYSVNFSFDTFSTLSSYFDVRGIAVYNKVLSQPEIRALYFNT